jgi:hypothetical protein
LKLFIKYLVSNRCKMAVKEELQKLGFHFVLVDLGEVEVMETLSKEQLLLINQGLKKSGLELMDDKKAQCGHVDFISREIILNCLV